MLYLSEFQFPTEEDESDFLMCRQGDPWDTDYYPFGVLSAKEMPPLDLEPVTILYGGNGSGKSTALNVMAEALRLNRDTAFNQTRFFDAYAARCEMRTLRPVPRTSRFICSDDVFDYMLNLRAVNNRVDVRREELFEEYNERRADRFQFRSMADYDRLKQACNARRTTRNGYVRQRLANNIPTHSNGESAMAYFVEHIQSDALYLLDEPENSLSASRQRELAQFLSDSARFYNCQLVIATHSPFLLAMPGAKIYDLDAYPVQPRRWTELENVREYYDFFREHREEF